MRSTDITIHNSIRKNCAKCTIVITLHKGSNLMEFGWLKNMKLAKTPYRGKVHLNPERGWGRTSVGLAGAVSLIPNVLGHRPFWSLTV